MSKSIIKDKTFKFALETIKIFKLLREQNEYILSKQLLRSGTSIGANVREALNAESIADFIHKFSIAQKECDETLYWLELLMESGFVDRNILQIALNEADEILKIIKSIIIPMKSKM
ncbi:MAG: four helix bundle protein [Bacteroidota bacterium]|nr:four helix bundle protein [Bacteroidota bacterium]